MKIEFDVDKIHIKYHPYIGKVRAMYNAVTEYIIAYYIRHGKYPPSRRQIGFMIFNRMPESKKELLYTRWEIAKLNYRIKYLEKQGIE